MLRQVIVRNRSALHWLAAAGFGLALAGCNNDDALITLPESEPEITALAIYVVHDSVDTLSVFRLDLETRGVTEVNSGVPTGTAPLDVAARPQGDYVYTINNSANDISGFAIDPDTGDVTELATSGWGSGGDPTRLSIDATGEWLVDVRPADGDIDLFRIDADSGDLTNDFNPQPAGFVTGAALHPSGGYVYAFNTGGSAPQFSFSGSDDMSIIGGGAHTPAGSRDLRDGVVHPDGDYLYATDDGQTEVITLQIAGDGTLSDHANLAIGTGGGTPRRIAIEPSGTFVYVAHQLSSALGALEVLGDGSLSAVPGSPFSVNLNADALTVDPTGEFLMVAHGSDDMVSIFEIDPADGTISEIGDSPIATDQFPVGVTAVGLSIPAN